MAMGATSAFDFFTSEVNDFINFSSFLDTSSYKKKQVKLQTQKQLLKQKKLQQLQKKRLNNL